MLLLQAYHAGTRGCPGVQGGGDRGQAGKRLSRGKARENEGMSDARES